MSDWMDCIDFAWVAADDIGHVALCYVDRKFVPASVRAYYSRESYEALTSHIIDELVGTNGRWPESDTDRGFFVYLHRETSGTYERVAEPSKKISIESLAQFRASIVLLKNTNFSCAQFFDPTSIIDV